MFLCSRYTTALRFVLYLLDYCRREKFFSLTFRTLPLLYDLKNGITVLLENLKKSTNNRKKWQKILKFIICEFELSRFYRLLRFFAFI